MTPSEPSVEASEALALALHNAVDGDFLIDAGGPDDWRGLSECGIADVVRWATTAVIAAGWTSPADHERAVRQARTEGAAEALREARDLVRKGLLERLPWLNEEQR